MVVQCSAPGCDIKSSPQTRKDNINFFKFPLHDPRRLEIWTDAVNYGLNEEERIQPNQYSSLCSLHFEENYIVDQRLKPNAIPTKFNGKIINIKKAVSTPVPKTPITKKISSTSVKSKKEDRSFKASPYGRPPKSTPKSSLHNSLLKSKFKPAKTKPKPLSSKIIDLLKQPILHPAISKTLIVKLLYNDAFCAVPNCEAELNKETNLVYVSFPTDYERYEEWVTLMGRPDLLRGDGLNLAKNLVICTTHFNDEMWVKSKTRNSRLVKHAVPSIFPISIKEENDTDDDLSSPKLKGKTLKFEKDETDSDEEGLHQNTKHMTIQEKLKIFKEVDKREEPNSQIRKKYGLTKKCMSNLLKSRSKIVKTAETKVSSPAKKSKSVQSFKNTDWYNIVSTELERNLMIWIKKRQTDGVTVTDQLVLTKSKQLYKYISEKHKVLQVSFEEFNPENAWFNSFKEAIGLPTKKKNSRPRKRFRESDFSDDDDDIFKVKSPTKKAPPAKKRKAITRESFGEKSFACPVCSRELSKWERLKNHLVNIHDYYINENDNLVPPGALDEDSSEAEPMTTDDFLQVNFFEGPDAAKFLENDKSQGVEAILKSKCTEIDELKREIEQLKKAKTTEGGEEGKETEKDEAPKPVNPELKYTQEDKKLWENLIVAEIKKSEKYMLGFNKAHKVVNAQRKENNALKQQLKQLSKKEETSTNNASYALKKKLNDEIQKNKKLTERVRFLQEENKTHRKSGGGDSSLKNEKIGSMYVKLRKTEEVLKQLNTTSSEQAKQFKLKYTQQSKQFQNKIRLNARKYGKLQKKCKMMSSRLNGIREVGSVSQIIRDASKYLTHQQVTFCEGQMKANTQANERFWSPTFQELIHCMYQTSPKAYKIYQKFFALPSVNVVKKWIAENELVTRGINEAFVATFTEPAKSLHELEEAYDKFSQNPKEISEKNNNTKFDESESEKGKEVQNKTDIEQDLKNEAFDMNGLDQILERDEEEIECAAEEDDEGKMNDKDDDDNTDDAIFDSDDEEEGVIKSDDEDNVMGNESDWSNESDTPSTKKKQQPSANSSAPVIHK